MTRRARHLAAAAVGGGAGLLVLLLLRDAGAPAIAAGGVAVAAALLLENLLGHRQPEAGAAPVPQRLPDPPRPGSAAVTVPVAALADAAMVVADWRIVAANDAAGRLFGARMAGSDLRQSIRHPAVAEALLQAMTEQAPVSREMMTLGQREGDQRLRVAPAGPGQWLLTFTDISQARLAERSRADFVANASHELRTPLANIMGFIETLQGPAASDAAARERFLGIMGREAARMARLIDDLLSLSRIEIDRYVRPQTVIDLRPLVEDAVHSFGQQAGQDGRSFAIDLPNRLPLVVADHDQILQVLYNLLSNALKYGRPGTPVTIRADVEPQSRGGAMVRVAIGDEGEGIPPEHLPRLTERFYRADAGRSRSLGGTGLGLAIVKHIIERHRGRFEIESRPGEGTTVAFLLPVAETATP
jgi:two-component system phosphate regulon sensor histidine kinase PhoR